MNTVTQLEAHVLPVTKIEVTDEQGKKTTYQLVLDYNAIAKAEPLLSKVPEIRDEAGKVITPTHPRDLAKISDWMLLTGPDLSVICWAAFDRFNPDVTLRQVRQFLAPAQNDALFAMLFEAAYPGVLEELVKAQQARAAMPEGETSPNAPAVASA
jgi:hypothetical protein